MVDVLVSLKVIIVSRVHILNGDSLKYQLQNLLTEDYIVARECMIDGNVQGESLSELYQNRAASIAQYDGFEAKDYYLKTVPEIEKIVAIASTCDVICWFEDDLFCQTNFWFVIHLLARYAKVANVHLVRPNKGNEYSFANMSEQALGTALDNRQQLTSEQINGLAKLWPLYQQNNCNEMVVVAAKLSMQLPFLLPAIEAQRQRAPDESGLGYPERQLVAIMNELNSTEFSTVFRTFSQQEQLYSFGDLQVKRMFEQLISSN